MTTKDENSTTTVNVASKKAGEAAMVSDAGIENAIKAAKDEASKKKTNPALEIQVESKKNDERFALALTKKAIESIEKSGIGSLVVNSAIGTVRLENKTVAAIAKQAKGETVEISVVKADAKLSAAQKEALGKAENAKVYDVTVTSGAQQITAFGGASWLCCALVFPA